MKAGAWVVLASLVVGFLGGWILRSPAVSEGTNPAVDSVLLVAPLKARAESLQAEVKEVLASVGDSTKKYKDRADSLRQVLVSRRASRGRAQPVPSPATLDTLPRAPLPGNSVDTMIPIIIDTTRPDTALVVGPRDYGECMEDLTTVDAEAASLRDALTACENDTERLQGSLSTLAEENVALFAFRTDTLPKLIQKARAEVKPCTEDWLVVKVGCGTAGWVKFGTGGILGFLIAR